MSDASVEIKDYGLEYSLIEIDEKELSKNGYKKLSENLAATASAIFQYVPSNIALEAQRIMADKNAEEMAKGAYKVLLKEGLHLGKSKSTPGAYKGLAFNDENDLVGQADWVELKPVKMSRTPQIVAGVFSAMSMVTSQYYLAEINKKMESLDKKMDNLKEFLLNEKRAQVWADNQVLDQIYSNLKYIMDNPFERQVVLTQVLSVKRDALSNISFFDKQIHSKLKQVSPKAKRDEIEGTIKEILEYMPEYWNSLWAYEKAVLLEVVIAEMDAPEYLSNILDAISEYKSMYFNTLEDCRKELNTIIDNANSFNPDFWTVALAAAMGAAIILIPGKAKFAVAGGAGAVLTANEATKAYTKSRLKEEISKYLVLCNNSKHLDRVTDHLLEYKNIRNCPVEFIQCGDNMYFKCIEPPKNTEEPKKRVIKVGGRILQKEELKE